MLTGINRWFGKAPQRFRNKPFSLEPHDCPAEEINFYLGAEALRVSPGPAAVKCQQAKR
jgi:hypothetical protein